MGRGTGLKISGIACCFVAPLDTATTLPRTGKNVQLLAILPLSRKGRPGKRYIVRKDPVLKALYYAMFQYLKDEHETKKGAPLPGDWTLTPTSQDTPRQHNGYDCGVFATFCAHYVSVGAAPAFDQADIPQLRERMMLDILNKQLHS